MISVCPMLADPAEPHGKKFQAFEAVDSAPLVLCLQYLPPHVPRLSISATLNLLAFLPRHTSGLAKRQRCWGSTRRLWNCVNKGRKRPKAKGKDGSQSYRRLSRKLRGSSRRRQQLQPEVERSSNQPRYGAICCPSLRKAPWWSPHCHLPLFELVATCHLLHLLPLVVSWLTL